MALISVSYAASLVGSSTARRRPDSSETSLTTSGSASGVEDAGVAQQACLTLRPVEAGHSPYPLRRRGVFP